MRPRLTLSTTITGLTADLPTKQCIDHWLTTALLGQKKLDLTAASIYVAVIDEAESHRLNTHFLGKVGPTNVLAFPAESDYTVSHQGQLGELFLCANKIAQEASSQDKPLHTHWAHLVIHGCLHLCGYDHILPTDADLMEALEIKLLNALHFPNPYEIPPC